MYYTSWAILSQQVAFYILVLKLSKTKALFCGFNLCWVFEYGFIILYAVFLVFHAALFLLWVESGEILENMLCSF